jgi:hypothetical protein
MGKEYCRLEIVMKYLQIFFLLEYVLRNGDLEEFGRKDYDVRHRKEL